MARPLRLHGNRRPVPREKEAVAFFCVHGVLFVGLALLTARHVYRKRIIPAFTTSCIVVFSMLRIALASMELHLDPNRPERRREEDFATLDAVAFVPFMFALMFHFLDYATYKATRAKESYKYIKKWQLISLAALGLVATVVYFVGCILTLQVDLEMPYLFQTGAVLYTILALLMCASIYQLPTENPIGPPRVILGSAATIRIVWTLASTWSILPMTARFSPFRMSNEGVWTHLGMVLVMELLVSIICCYHADQEDKYLPVQQAPRSPWAV